MQQRNHDVWQRVQECLPRAQAPWPSRLRLPPPVLSREQTTLLQVDLGKRQIALHPDLLRDRGLLDCCEALLAHALGHLLRHPSTPAARARLALLERLVLPFPHPGVVEPFADLLVDAALDRSLRA